MPPGLSITVPIVCHLVVPYAHLMLTPSEEFVVNLADKTCENLADERNEEILKSAMRLINLLHHGRQGLWGLSGFGDF